MICVECGSPVPHAFREYGKGNIRLTRCDNCHCLADKYVEFEFIIIFLDLLLLRPQVYRHLLFNRMPYHDKGLDLYCYPLLAVYLLFEAYVKYSTLYEYYTKEENVYDWVVAPYAQIPLIFLITVVEWLVYIFGILVAAHFAIGKSYAIIKYNYLVMAIILSSFGKSLLMFLMLWDYRQAFNTVLNVFVLTSNAVAVKAFLENTTHAVTTIAFGFELKLMFRIALYFIVPWYLFEVI